MDSMSCAFGIRRRKAEVRCITAIGQNTGTICPDPKMLTEPETDLLKLASINTLGHVLQLFVAECTRLVDRVVIETVLDWHNERCR